MKKIILVLVSILLLIGCSDKNFDTNPYIEATTYNEVIKDNKVVFDGISYDIQSISTETVTYDKNDNRKKVTKYTDGDLYSTSYYDYKDDKLIKAKQVNEDGLEYISKYTYGDDFIKVNMVASDEEMSMISTSYLDENDRVLKTEMMKDGVVTTTNTYHYEEDELKKMLSYREGELNTTYNFEYNNIGNMIVLHTIYHNQDDYITVEFFDYEYDDNMLPKAITKSWIRSEREDFSITIN